MSDDCIPRAVAGRTLFLPNGPFRYSLSGNNVRCCCFHFPAEAQAAVCRSRGSGACPDGGDYDHPSHPPHAFRNAALVTVHFQHAGVPLHAAAAVPGA